MTGYATAPVTGSVYGDDGGLGELMVDAWMGVDVTIPADLVDTFDDHRILTMGPSGLFLVFEQGRNAEPYVLALKSAPTEDLTQDDVFVLRHLPDGPDESVYPQAVRDFYRPVAELIDRLARVPERSLQDRGVEVMTLLFDRIAELGILRAKEFDEDGDPIGLDRDIAAELPAAWAATVAREPAR